MTALALRKDEGIGLAVAAALHVALVAVLVLRPASAPVVLPPERIEVSIAEETGLTSASPNPFEQAAPDVAPELGEAQPEPAPAAPQPVVPEPPAPFTPPPPKPEPVPQPKPKPVAKVAAKPAPKPAPKAPVKPQPKTAAKPDTRKSPIDAIVKKPSASTAKGTAKSASTATKPSAKPATSKAGGSKVGDDFLDGVKGAQSTTGKGAPAAITGAVRSSLGSEIKRQIKPHWSTPQGADAELLVTKVRFRLNPDGSLAGEPQVVGTTGQTPSNQSQVARHQEQAVRAVKLAAPFNLPEKFYDGWKVITTNFDRNLSQ